MLFRSLFVLFSRLGVVLGWIMTHIMLTVVFYLILTPISVISRLFGKQFLDTEIDPDRTSYWRDHGQSVTSEEHFEKQY